MMEQQNFSNRDFRDAMSHFATGIVVVSTKNQEDSHAMTANAFMSGSLNPPMVIISIDNKARIHEKIAQEKKFGVSILTKTQERVSNHFAGRDSNGYQPEFKNLLDIPVIENAAVQLVAKLVHSYACGDHTLFVGYVLHLIDAGDQHEPLIFHQGQYKA